MDFSLSSFPFTLTITSLVTHLTDEETEAQEGTATNQGPQKTWRDAQTGSRLLTVGQG